MEWIYQLPNWLFFLFCAGSTIAFAIIGLILIQPWVKSHADTYPDQNDLVSYYLGASGVIYGIALGLVAAGVWANFQGLSAQVDEEAAIVATLYQDMSTYPQPQRQQFQQALRNYTQTVINQDWADHRRGITPRASSRVLHTFKLAFFDFTPTTARLRLIHEQGLTQFNDLAKTRRLRLRGNQDNLPSILWWVIILGTAINLAISWFFVTKHPTYQLLLTVLIALLLGSLLFLIAAMDNPFRGDFSVDPGAFEAILTQMGQS